MRKSLISAACVIGLCLSSARAVNDPLVAGFEQPPLSAKPQTWWHWMNGNITKEGITADLEAMHRVGIQEANIITVASDIPPGPVPVMSPQFFDMVEFAAKEADRLGMTLCMDNCPGWSSSGGPWVKPENAMQTVTSSEKHVTGPMKFNAVLPQPAMKKGFYRDIAVLAFKTPAGEDAPPLRSYSPVFTASAPGLDFSSLLDGKSKTSVSLPAPTKSKPSFLQIELPHPVNASTLTIMPGPGNGAWSGSVQVSTDGSAFTTVDKFSADRHSHAPISIALDHVPAGTRFYRLEITKTANAATGIAIAEISLSSQLRIGNISPKAGFTDSEVDPRSVEKSAAMPAPADLIIHQAGIIDLTSATKPDGTLNWDVPPGDWTILRFGYTPTGVTNHPAPPEATGLECDKLSKTGLDASWNGMMQPILDRLGPLGGKVLVDCLIDSYETGGQNWTPAMIQEFKARRGYDPTRFLPVMTGRVVDSPAVSERFLWDIRRTIADLFADNYFGYFTDLCHKHGMKSMIEPYTGPFESLQSGSRNDIPMGEFWAGSNGQASVKLASSIGHIYGQPIIATESFTGAPDHGRWTDTPYSLKALGDLAFSEGINRFVFHRYAHQPWMNRFPGMTMGQWGINLERTNTWFEKSKPWMDYISRSQFLLQQGRFVADAAYFCGQSCPVVTRIGAPPLPKGYDYDSINADVLLNKASVKDGRLVLADGMSYAVLVLPESDPEMTPPLLKKIRDFVNNGLTVVGPRPAHSPSLENFPQCDADVKSIASELWGNCDGTTVKEHDFGKGKIVWGKTLDDVMTEMKLAPDFETGSSKSPLLYIHRTIDAGDLYFVANHGDTFVDANCSFRVQGKIPEFWHPDTGGIEKAPAYSEADGRTTLPIRLDPSGSVFVLFREPQAAGVHVVSVTPEDSVHHSTQKSSGLEIRKATYSAVDGTVSKDVTKQVQSLESNGALSMEAANGSLGGDPAVDHVKQLTVQYAIDGKPMQLVVPENSRIELPEGADSQSPATFDLRTTAQGTTELFPRYAGTFDVKTSAGTMLKLTADDVPAPVAVDGPWTLKFPPNWGAPASVTLDKLISWPEHPDKGIKYFSGTASYFNHLDIPAGRLASGRAVYLDLGTVKNFAEVKLNGKSLGIFWKPPFRIDITPFIKAGANSLEIDVTNLWPNRIIGDAQLPEDTEWNGMKPAGWPKWLLEGKPSPTGRFTFTTWRHWTKEGKLLKSGLIGPVRLEFGSWMPVKTAN